MSENQINSDLLECLKDAEKILTFHEPEDDDTSPYASAFRVSLAAMRKAIATAKGNP